MLLTVASTQTICALYADNLERCKFIHELARVVEVALSVVRPCLTAAGRRALRRVSSD